VTKRKSGETTAFDASKRGLPDVPMTQIPISIFVIAQDEAANIARCLKSVAPLSDDVLVIDGGSTDSTQQIAEGLGARVIENAWPGFAAQKNFALENCRHDWVLTLDSDEELSPALRDEIVALQPRLNEFWVRESVGAWAMPRRVRYEGKWIKHGDWNPDFGVRLFRREGARYEGAVHESLKHAGTVRRLTRLLWHYSYRDRTDHLARLEKYSTLWAQAQAESGKRAGAASPYTRAAWRFMRGYILKGGFLDGALGLRIARFSAWETKEKYRKLRSLQK
jgi:glycosyltransferase involved in cell wall biosynthesis